MSESEMDPPGLGGREPAQCSEIQAGLTPRVSIAMVSFRHEHWVGDAIESVLMQDEPDWEIVLGDDASDDATVEVARSYLDRCMWNGRQRLRILPHEVKVMPRPNIRRVLDACTGQYVAMLDGDDFYVASHALSARADFLDANADHAAVFCAWNETDAKGQPVEERRMLGGKTRYRLDEFGPYCPCTSAAVMFRRDLIGDLPDWWMRAPVGDWPLHVLNLQHGDMGYIDEVLAIHRNHSDGVWSKKSDLQKLQTCLDLQTLFVTELPEPHSTAMRRSILAFNAARSQQCLDEGLTAQARALGDWVARFQLRREPRIRAWERRLRHWLRSRWRKKENVS